MRLIEFYCVLGGAVLTESMLLAFDDKTVGFAYSLSSSHPEYQMVLR